MVSLETLTFKQRHKYNTEDGIQVVVDFRTGRAGPIRTRAKIDTGAARCIFRREHAEALEIVVEDGELVRFRTATGSFEAYGHTVTLSCLDLEFDALVFFTRDYDFPRQVLGLQGWLDKLRLGLVHHDELLFLSQFDD